MSQRELNALTDDAVLFVLGGGGQFSTRQLMNTVNSSMTDGFRFTESQIYDSAIRLYRARRITLNTYQQQLRQLMSWSYAPLRCSSA
jgi:hypothetical protein